MSTATAPQTELEAINMMLAAVFEAPVNTLEPVGIEDVAIALRMLRGKVREVCMRGLAFNSEREVTLTPDSTTNKIPLPSNTLRVDSEASDGLDVVQRGGFLYDRENHRFTFERAVSVEIIYAFEWTDLPEHVKYPIAILASRRFQKHTFGDADKGGYDSTDEFEAKSLLKEADADTEDSNMTTDSWSVYSILER